jgi:sulfite exporter TauE/SafE/copper chaperone CopZ
MAKELSFTVLGTKCASCEIVLERELKTLAGVQKVEASHDAGRVLLTVDDDAHFEPSDLEHVVGKHGYRFERPAAPSPSHSAASFSWKRLGAVIIVVLALYLLAKKTGLLVYSPAIEGGTTLGAVFVIGLVAAVSSCTAVVSGLIVAVSASVAKRYPNATRAQKIRPHVLFNIGRLVGFAGFGAVVGLIGRVLTLAPAANGVLVILVALLMIAIGLNLLDVFPEGTSPVRIPKALSRRIVGLADSSHPGVPLVLGALTFFLPCGFTQSMQLYALTTGDPLRGAEIMAVFALGTIPALLGVGLVTAAVKGPTLRRVSQVAGVIVIVLGISNVQNGATLLGLRTSHPISSGDLAPIVDGKQEIQMEVTGYGVYAPDTFRVIEGTPVNWEIFGDNNMGCGSVLVAPDFGVNAHIAPGYNTVAFTPTEPGEFVFTCSMGMMRGTIVVEPRS